MIWIWVKCGGNSRWPVQDDFRRGCVGLGLVKKEMSVSGVLLHHAASDVKKDSATQKSEWGSCSFWPDRLQTDIILGHK